MPSSPSKKNLSGERKHINIFERTQNLSYTNTHTAKEHWDNCQEVQYLLWQHPTQIMQEDSNFHKRISGNHYIISKLQTLDSDKWWSLQNNQVSLPVGMNDMKQDQIPSFYKEHMYILAGHQNCLHKKQD